ncbi:MAG: peptidoglycan DD-metalloendopeptidase family protein [Methylococcales bacterium]|nr:peptidoglycan DD-metalloendopeptidase family protein [Methylococcales bacterium]
MRDRLIITITDLNGSKHFNVHQIIKKIVLGIILVTIVTFTLGTIIIKVLINDVANLEEKKDSLNDLNIDYELRINALNSQIGQKSLELKTFSDSLEDIESLIGLREDDKDLPLKERVNLAKIGVTQKHHMLNSIPNGSPIGTNRATDKFGWRIHPIKKKKVFHKGIDLKAKKNTLVRAPADGIVEYAGYHKKSGFGKLLIIIHNYGFKSYYAHLNKINVKFGEVVNKGQKIALTGNTGLSNGPHLHYEVRYVGVSIDPTNFINWNINNYESIFTKTKGIKWQSLVNMIARNLAIQ